MELSPSWEAKSWSVTQEIPNIWRNPKVYYGLHKNLSLVLIHCHMNPVHSSLILLPNPHFNITILHLGVPSELCPSDFPTKTFYAVLANKTKTLCVLCCTVCTLFIVCTLFCIVIFMSVSVSLAHQNMTLCNPLLLLFSV
jgi:hypothetical protein